MKPNLFADKATENSRMQLNVSFQHKRPRMTSIRAYRAAYNNARQRQFRVRYSAPLPIFAGIIDTLMADLDDEILLEYKAQDPADWRAAVKANAALEKESGSNMPNASWQRKWRLFKQEMMFTGRGIFRQDASKVNGFTHTLSNVVFEDFHFEPRGGYDLENHLFCGQANIWLTKSDLEQGVKDGLYDAGQVKKLTAYNDSDFKFRGMMEWDDEARFRPLGLSPDLNNWVGEPVYNMILWEFVKDGKRYHELFEYLTGTWVMFEKLEDVNSSGLWSWVSAATHEDQKNFASKGYADDIYPHAVSMNDLFNEYMENIRRRNSNARVFDKDVFTNEQELQEAQVGRDALVRADTKGGTRDIRNSLVAIETPAMTDNILNVVSFLKSESGTAVGVTPLQQGSMPSGTGTRAYAIMALIAQVQKRLGYQSQPMIQAGKQVGIRFFGALKDYLTEPLSIRLLGENGYEWDLLKRIDLNTKKDFEISVTSRSAEDAKDQMAQSDSQKALAAVAQSPNINDRARTEFALRDVGHYSEDKIAILMDTSGDATKNSDSIASAAVQSMMLGKMPEMNYKADYWFLRRITDFVQGNLNDKRVKKNFQQFMKYIDMHTQIATQNMQQKAKDDFLLQSRSAGMPQSTQPGKPSPQSNPQKPNTPMESINFKDMPPSGQSQMASQAGIRLSGAGGQPTVAGATMPGAAPIPQPNQ